MHPGGDQSAAADQIKKPIKNVDASPPSAASIKKMATQARFANESIWARIAYHQYFELTTMGVICVNAIWIGVDTEWNHERMKDDDGKLPLSPVSDVIENLFCLYFTFELFVRFRAFKSKKMCFLDAWFMFDGLLVACMIFETWVMVIVTAIMDNDSGGAVGPLAALRLLRLLRLARVGRLMRFVPELLKLVKGMVKAVRSVFFILVFLIIVIYVFSIIFTGTLSDRTDFPLTPFCNEFNETEQPDGCIPDGEMFPDDVTAQDLFATMGDSFMSLFTRGVLGDNLDETFDAILAAPGAGGVLFWLFLIFLIITFATLLNMLIGVVCEIINDAAAEEEEAETVNALTHTIQEAFDEIDENHDGLVSNVEWEHIKENRSVRNTLISVGIEKDRMEERLAQMQEMLFEENGDEQGAMSSSLSATAVTRVSTQNMMRSSTTKSGDRSGLTVDELIEKVVEIRPNQDASALDLELLNAQVMKDQKRFKAKLKRIEERIKKTLGPKATAGDVSDMPDMPSLPNMLMDAEEETPKLRLEDVPTALLFQALQERSGPKVTCPNGHQLQKSVKSTPGSNTCDKCGRTKIVPPEHVFRCEQCDYDLCQKCYADARKEHPVVY